MAKSLRRFILSQRYASFVFLFSLPQKVFLRALRPTRRAKPEKIFFPFFLFLSSLSVAGGVPGRSLGLS